MARPYITTFCADAISRARRVAAEDNHPQTVWRFGPDPVSYAVLPEGTDPLPLLEGPIRPVAVYDPDGTEHC
jgi:hypothetical protein